MNNGRWNYARIKQEAWTAGVLVADLLALVEKNDPFYTGRPAEVAAAEWFAELWRQFGYGTGVHLRRVHYQLVSQDPPMARPDCALYENTERDWGYLCEAGKHARYLGLVSPTAFVDRRNPEAKIYAYWYGDSEPEYSVRGEWDDSGYDLPDVPQLGALPTKLPDLADFKVEGYDGIQQGYHVEVWCEKTTMNDVLVPLCRWYDTNLITGAGEMSITAVVDFLRRVRGANRPARILYVSDYDPAGLGMPISVARKIEYFQREEGFDDLDIRLQPIALTAEQVATYKLPRVPVKDSDRRKGRWVQDHGEGQVELDALEALHPGELRRIVQGEIRNYYDPHLQHRANETMDKLLADLDEQRAEIVEHYQDEVDELRDEYRALFEEFEKTRAEFDELVADFRPRIDAYAKRLEDIKERGADLYERIESALGDVEMDMDDYALPEPDLPDETNAVLYVSARDYLTQLVSYKSYRQTGEL